MEEGGDAVDAGAEEVGEEPWEGFGYEGEFVPGHFDCFFLFHGMGIEDVVE